MSPVGAATDCLTLAAVVLLAARSAYASETDRQSAIPCEGRRAGHRHHDAAPVAPVNVGLCSEPVCSGRGVRRRAGMCRWVGSSVASCSIQGALLAGTASSKTARHFPAGQGQQPGPFGNHSSTGEPAQLGPGERAKRKRGRRRGPGVRATGNRNGARTPHFVPAFALLGALIPSTSSPPPHRRRVVDGLSPGLLATARLCEPLLLVAGSSNRNDGNAQEYRSQNGARALHLSW